MTTIALVRKADNVILQTRIGGTLPVLVSSKPFHWLFLNDNPPAYDTKRQYLTIDAPTVDATSITVNYTVNNKLAKDILAEDNDAIKTALYRQEFENALIKNDYAKALKVLLKKGVI